MQQAVLSSTQPKAQSPDRQAAGERVVARLKGSVRGQMYTDPLMTYAWSGDASSYRLIPAAVVFVNSEDEVRAVFRAARAEGLPVTFRAAGTSLSGQADRDRGMSAGASAYLAKSAFDRQLLLETVEQFL